MGDNKATGKIDTVEVPGDPPVTLYYLELESRDGVATEAFQSREQLEIFLRGVRIGCAMSGHFPDLPEIPTGR